MHQAERKTNLITFVKTWSILFIVGATLLLIGYEGCVRYRDFNRYTKMMQKNHIEHKKELIKREVGHVIRLINYELEQNDNKITEQTKNRLLKEISEIRFCEEGYIFITRLNGDVLVSHGTVFSGNKKLWKVFDKNSKKVKYIFKKGYTAAMKPYGGFIYYSFARLTNLNVESPKVSFIYRIPQLQWLVGAGLYLDDMEKKIASTQNELSISLRYALFYSIAVVVIVVLVFILLLKSAFDHFQNDLEQFSTFFKKTSYKNKPIDLQNIKYLQFTEMAQSANKMLQDKIEVQKKLSEERELLEITFQSLGDAIITTDKLGNIKLLNGVAEMLTGWTLVESEGKQLNDIFHVVNAVTGEPIINPVESVIKSGKTIGLADHTKLISKSGIEYQIEDSAAPIKNNNEIIGIVLVFRDVTKEYRLQEEIRQSEKKYRLFFENNDAKILLTSAKTGEIIFANKAAARFYGYNHEQFSCMNISNLTESKEYITDQTLVLSKHKLASGEMRDVELYKTKLLLDNEEVYSIIIHDITDRKRSEEALRLSEESYKGLLNNGILPTVIHDFDGKVLFMNKKAIAVLKIKDPDNIYSMSVKEFMHPDYVEDNLLFINKIRNENISINREQKFVDASKNIIDVEIFGKLARFQNKEAIQITFNDITERNRVINSLRESEERYSRLSDLTYEGILIHKNGIVIDVNSALEKISGYTSNELIGENIFTLLILEKDQAKFLRNMQKQINTPFEIAGITKGRKIIDVEIESRNIEYNEESVQVTVIRDITRRKKNEYEILKLSNAVEQSPVSIAITDVNGIFEYVNPKFTKVTGYSLEELSDKTSRILKSDKHSEEFYKTLWNTILSGNEWRGEFHNKKKNGELFWESVVISPIKNKKGRTTHFLAVKEDITKNKNILLELLKSKEKVENADKMKSVFLAQMSHEIRTPINALVSMAALIKYDFENMADKDQLMSFDIIDRAGERIIRTVDLLLNLSEIQAGTYELEKVKINIYADIIAPIIAENKKLAKKNNIDLKLEIVTHEQDLVADSYTLIQIFTQLIENAIKYTSIGNVKVTIFRNESEQLIVEVKDTGIGISDEYFPKLFEAFTQEEMGYTRRYEGNGLGLALVKTYCDLNNAKIEVESEKGVGSIFRVIFL